MEYDGMKMLSPCSFNQRKNVFLNQPYSEERCFNIAGILCELDLTGQDKVQLGAFVVALHAWNYTYLI
jgi:hypothetical protein